MTATPHTIDKPLLYALLLLAGSGFLILGSASMVLSLKNTGTITYYIFRQIILGGIVGIVLLIAGSKIPYRIWKKAALPLVIVSFILLIALFIPQLSFAVGGARRWLSFGPINFQPAEVLKFSFTIYLASWLDARKKQVASVSYGLIPFSIMLAIVGMLLVMQPDIGTLGVIVITAGILYFLGGGRISQIATLIAFGFAILYFLIQLAPYRLARLTVFLNPGHDPQGVGYQITQAFIAIGSGGFWGRGFGASLQKYNYLPEPMGDSVFAIFAEELGFLGVLGLLFLFGFIFWRGMHIAKNAPDVFGKLLAAGISVSLMVQAFINIAAISGLLPLTGIPLPFVSFGGTSLAISLASMGVLLNISRYT